MIRKAIIALTLAVFTVRTVGWVECCTIRICKRRNDPCKDDCKEKPASKATAIKHLHEGVDYSFCADACAEKFKADPEKFTPHCTCRGTKKACACDHCGGKEPCDGVK
jgi:YHS domain-containing protein